MTSTNHDFWNLLYIEDDEEDYILVREMLAQAQGHEVKLTRAATYAEGERKLDDESYDAVLVDYDLGERTGIELIRDHSTYPSPFILYTGRGSYEVDAEAMEAGASLYITKGDANTLTLERFIRYAIERKRMEQELERNLRQKSTILQSIQDGLFGLDRNWCFTYLNDRARLISDRPADEMIGRNIWELYPRLIGTVNEKMYRKVMEERAPLEFESPGIIQNVWYNIHVYPSDEGISVYVQDITERRRAEEAVRVSERKFNLVFENNAFPAAISKLPSGEIVDVNPAWVHLFGYSREEAVGRTTADMGINPDMATRQRLLKEMQAKGSVCNQEMTLRTKSGEERVVSVNIDVLEFNGGQYLLNMAQDITERKRTEEGLRQLSRAVEQSPACVVITDITGKIEYVNPKFTRLTGYSYEEAIGNNPRILKSGQTPPEVYRDLWSTILAGKSWEGELCNRKKNGEIYWEFVSISPIINEEGTVTHFVAVKEDITERKHVEQALQEAHDYAAWMARFPEENPNPVARVSSEGIVLYANLPARELPGWKCETGKQLPETLKVLVDHAIAQDDEVQQDIQLKDKFYTISALPFLQEGYANLYGRDITERLRAEQALRESEERFIKAFEASPNAIVISRQQDGLIQTVNSAFEKLFAYHRDEVIGRRSTDLNMFARVEDRQQAVSQLIHDEIVHDFETEILTKHGEVRSVLLSAAVITVGQETSMVTVITDVTERKHTEEAIRQSVERERARTAELETLMDTVPAMIWISRDPLCQTMTGNRFGYEALHMWPGANLSETAPDEDLAKQTFRSFRNGREIPIDELPMQMAARTGEPTTNYDYDIVFADGSVMSVLGNVNPLFDESGKPTGAVAAFMDITDRRKIEEQLKRNTEELERSNQALQDFASIASHDLREPLRKVEAFGHMLESRYANEVGDQGKDYISRMTSAATRMSSMLDGLLSYSRVTSQAKPFEPVDLAKVVSEVLVDLDARLLQTGGRVNVFSLPVIQADPLQMRQLFQNLLGNALKYHQPGVPPVVTVSSKRNENQVEIVVNDNGIGFDMKDARHLFEPFTRLNKRGEYEGSGMGLAICKKIIERHNGAIEADSIPGKGSTFKIILPTDL